MGRGAGQPRAMTSAAVPVELMAVSFGADAQFEGRIADEIDKLERAGLIRVLDFLFVRRERESGELVRVDYDGDGLVARLIDGDRLGAGVSGLTGNDIRAVADALEPGAAAAFMVFEHTWSGGLHAAIAEVGGTPFVEGFLAADVVSAAS
jgi:hypothetical protein